MELLTLKEEWDLSDVICSLHPHKKLLHEWKPKFYVIRPCIVTGKQIGRAHV